MAVHEVSQPATGDERADRPMERSLRDLGLAGGAAVVLALATLAAAASSVSDAEAAVFRAINAHTVLPFVVVWTLMQIGNVAAVPVAVIAAVVARRPRLAGMLAVSGGAGYYLAKQIKQVVERARPEALLEDVVIRGTPSLGLGYVSGHAAVTTALATVAWPWLGRRGHIAVVVAVIVVMLSRVYVGAHMPLDMVGGFALGVLVGSVINVAVGRPVRTAT